jgi:hypothetical protein
MSTICLGYLARHEISITTKLYRKRVICQEFHECEQSEAVDILIPSPLIFQLFILYDPRPMQFTSHT